jgi:putative chitinase
MARACVGRLVFHLEYWSGCFMGKTLIGSEKLKGGSKMTPRVLVRAKVVLPVAFLVLALILPTVVHASGFYHVVRPGENLTRIAARYGTTVHAIVRANHLRNPNRIYVGQRLYIPGGGYYPGPGRCRYWHIVRRGETLSRIAWRYGTSVWAIARANGLRNPNYIWAGQRLCIPGRWAPPPHCGMTHIVRRGQTLYSIARYYGTTVHAIARANGLWNPNLIYAGQRLHIPCW